MPPVDSWETSRTECRAPPVRISSVRDPRHLALLLGRAAQREGPAVVPFTRPGEGRGRPQSSKRPDSTPPAAPPATASFPTPCRLRSSARSCRRRREPMPQTARRRPLGLRSEMPGRQIRRVYRSGSRGVILSGISVAHGLEGCVRRAKEGAHDSSHNAVRLVGFVVVRSSGPGERRRWWRWRRRRRRRRCWCRKLGRRSWRRQWGGSRRRRQWGGSRRRADGRCLARSRSRDCHIQPR
jgi:hypothetical protein